MGGIPRWARNTCNITSDCDIVQSIYIVEIPYCHYLSVWPTTSQGSRYPRFDDVISCCARIYTE